MKNLLILSLVFYTCIDLNAQITKGTNFIGGYFNLGRNEDSYAPSSLFISEQIRFNFQLLPQYGHFIKNNFAIGISPIFRINNSTYTSEEPLPNPSTTTKLNSTSYGLGGFARIYKKTIENLFLTVTGGISYEFSHENRSSTNNENSLTNSNTIGISFRPGFCYFVTPKFGIETSIGSLYYTHSKVKSTTDLVTSYSHTNSYGLTFSGSSFFFGLNYYF